jgi:probable H4MPT-linked C1 transfer pathway protein
VTAIGWDIGGAHLKGARIEAGRVVAAAQIACPLWQGTGRLVAAFGEGHARLGNAPHHAVTMTGELTDIFASRAEGVARLADLAAEALEGRIAIYAAHKGWLAPTAAAGDADAVASANWHATASWLAATRSEALFADMGSTTTDLVPIAGGAAAVRGFSDAERLAAGELVYTGTTRTFLMAVAQRVPFRGVWTPVMNEYFASMADVHRICGALPEGADLHPAADNRDKTFEASCARLARMIGRDAAEAEAWEWRALGGFFAEAQLRAVHDAAMQVVSAAHLAPDAPLVAAGSGRFVLRRLAERLDRPYEEWETSVPAAPGLGAAIGDVAPAAAVGLLLLRDQGSPP